MAEEQQQQRWKERHRLCANNCGFFGSPATLDLCSKCYRDLHQPAGAAPGLGPSAPTAPTFQSSSSAVTGNGGLCGKRVGPTGFTCRCSATRSGTRAPLTSAPPAAMRSRALTPSSRVISSRTRSEEQELKPPVASKFSHRRDRKDRYTDRPRVIPKRTSPRTLTHQDLPQCRVAQVVISVNWSSILAVERPQHG